MGQGGQPRYKEPLTVLLNYWVHKEFISDQLRQNSRLIAHRSNGWTPTWNVSAAKKTRSSFNFSKILKSKNMYRQRVGCRFPKLEPTDAGWWQGNLIQKKTLRYATMPCLFNNKNHLGLFCSSFDRQNWSSNVRRIRTTMELHT